MSPDRLAVVEAPDIAERTFRFALRVVKLCQALDANPGVRRTLANQLLRSGTSVGANVTEAQAAQSRADFISKMNIALKEARETVYWLRLLTAANLFDTTRLAPLTAEIAQVIGAIVRTCRASRS